MIHKSKNLYTLSDCKVDKGVYLSRKIGLKFVVKVSSNDLLYQKPISKRQVFINN